MESGTATGVGGTNCCEPPMPPPPIELDVWLEDDMPPTLLLLCALCTELVGPAPTESSSLHATKERSEPKSADERAKRTVMVHLRSAASPRVPFDNEGQ